MLCFYAVFCKIHDIDRLINCLNLIIAFNSNIFLFTVGPLSPRKKNTSPNFLKIPLWHSRVCVWVFCSFWFLCCCIMIHYNQTLLFKCTICCGRHLSNTSLNDGRSSTIVKPHANLQFTKLCITFCVYLWKFSIYRGNLASFCFNCWVIFRCTFCR